MPDSLHNVRFTGDAAADGGHTPAHFTVSAVLQMAKSAVSRALPGVIWIKGEVTDFQENKGKFFLNLVEHCPGRRNAVIEGAIWEDKWPPVVRKLQAAGIEIKGT